MSDAGTNLQSIIHLLTDEYDEMTKRKISINIDLALISSLISKFYISSNFSTDFFNHYLYNAHE